MPTRNDSKNATKRLEQMIKTTRMIAIAALVIGVVAFLMGAIPIVMTLLQGPSPNFGNTLAGIDQPFTPAQLSVINNASLANYETAGEMYLNHSLPNVGTAQPQQTNTLVVNGKPSVIYLGAISCIYCAENRWAMALALAKFGQFGALYNGYSALQDGDVPTIYWKSVNYNTSSGASFGANYSSPYISFLPIEYESPIKQGFQVQSLSYFQNQAQTLGIGSYINATSVLLALNNFQGTPYTIWGRNVVPGADAIAFTNGTRTIMNMTHADVLRQIATPNNVFAWEQYAGADLYIAMTCPSIGNSAPVCALPAIKAIEKANGY
ncbi:MAG: DUF929 family protein [Candidatus Micrarchaeota archaeon]|nr:DUF929 family protein [Candidatus Micrarchaeota archaeon]